MHIPQRHVLFSSIEMFCLTILINRGRVFTFHLNLFLMVKCNIELLFVNSVQYTFIAVGFFDVAADDITFIRQIH